MVMLVKTYGHFYTPGRGVYLCAVWELWLIVDSWPEPLGNFKSL